MYLNTTPYHDYKNIIGDLIIKKDIRIYLAYILSFLKQITFNTQLPLRFINTNPIDLAQDIQTYINKHDIYIEIFITSGSSKNFLENI